MNHKQRTISGLGLLLKDVEGFSQTQGAWRFYNNENVDIESLSEPIITTGLQEIEKHCSEYILVAYDWSHLDYRGHTAKKECILTKRSVNGDKKSKGYDFQSALVISDTTGEPITPLMQNLKTDMRVYSTYNNEIDINLTHLEELTQRSRYVHTHFAPSKKIVDIVDREADSVGLFREYKNDENRFFIIRAKDQQKVEHNKSTLSQKELAKALAPGKFVKNILYKKKRVDIYVNETVVSISRDSHKKVINDDLTISYKKVKGEPFQARFIVEKLLDENQEVVATWILISNLQEDVSSKTIALWYYYRWNIESYFKLLKTSGFNLEQWQQRDPLALFKRLLIVSYACVLVWKIANSNHENSKKIRDFLVKLSGRLVEKKIKFTSSALLTGLWNFFSAMDILELYDFEELLKMKNELNQLMQADF